MDDRAAQGRALDERLQLRPRGCRLQRQFPIQARRVSDDEKRHERDERRKAQRQAPPAGTLGIGLLVGGHAFGGDNVRTVAQRYTRELAGLVLVEADVSIPGERRGDAARIAELRECRDAVASGKPLPPLPPRPGRPPRSCAQQFIRGLPEAIWSPELNAKLLELAETRVAMYDAYISEMEQMPEDDRYLEEHHHSLGSRPIRVLSTGYHGVHVIDPGHPLDPEQIRYEQEVARAQAGWLELSSDSKQLFTDKSSEYIPFDQPDFVVDAIREVYSQSRRETVKPPPWIAREELAADGGRDG